MAFKGVSFVLCVYCLPVVYYYCFVCQLSIIFDTDTIQFMFRKKYTLAAHIYGDTAVDERERERARAKNY